ncbi:MAG: zinc ribbon domain-containing protein [Myxococcota bacterium]
MPIYEYACSNCGQTHEILQKVDDPAPQQCPSCAKSNTLSKLMSRSAFHLKGGGWYKDLYASAKPKQQESKKEKSKDKGAAKADTDKKPAAKSEKQT